MFAVISGFSSVIAVLAGIQTFIAVFFAPVVFYGDDQVLLGWGWIAPFIGLPIAYFSAKLVRKITHSSLDQAYLAQSKSLVKVVVLALAISAFFAAIGWALLTAGDTNITWSENVTLGDGESIVVLRKVTGNVFGRPKNQPTAWLPSEFTIDATKANSSLSGSTTWRSSLRPVLLDKVDATGKLYLIAEPVDCGAWYELGKPKPPYLAFALGAGGWTPSKLPDSDIGRAPNLLLYPRFTGEYSTVSESDKGTRNNHGASHDKAVIRSSSGC